MQIEIIYADSQQDVYREQLELPDAATVADAIQRSGLLQQYPGLDWQRNKLGIFGRLVATDTPLHNHDRLEVYRPVIARKRKAQ